MLSVVMAVITARFQLTPKAARRAAASDCGAACEQLAARRTQSITREAAAVTAISAFVGLEFLWGVKRKG